MWIKRFNKGCENLKNNASQDTLPFPEMTKILNMCGLLYFPINNKQLLG